MGKDLFDPFYLEQTAHRKKRDFRIVLFILVIVLVGFLIVSFFKGLSDSQPSRVEAIDQVQKIIERVEEK